MATGTFLDDRQIVNRAPLSALGNTANLSLDVIMGDINTYLANATFLPTASVLMTRDANANTQANNFLEGFATTATAAGTTTLLVGSKAFQQFTGSTTQTVVLPAANTLTLGQSFTIVNRSTGNVTVQNTTPTTQQIMTANSQAVFTVTNIGSSAGVWDVSYTVTGPATFLQTQVTTDATTTGSAATLLANDILFGVTRLTNASLLSISGIPAGASGQQITIENQTGAFITINNNDAGATAANRIFTGTGAPVSMASNQTFELVYDTTVSRWMLVGGTGSGTGGSASSKNQLINGNFDFWQRGTSTTVANGATGYQADRWYVKNSLGTSGVITYSQTTGVSTGAKFGASVQITTAPTAAQTNGTELYQVIDNENTLLLLNNSLSFSAQIKALGNVATVGLQFLYATTEAKPTLTLVSEQSVAVNSSTFTLASLLAQSIGTTPTSSGVVAVRIRILTVSTGNTYDLNNGFVVEQAIANTGTTAATFERAGRNIADELVMCQRYYEKSYDLTVSPGTFPTSSGATCGVNTNMGAFVLCPVFKAAKRIIGGTVTLYNPTTGTIGQARDDSGSNITSSAGNIAQGNMEVTSSTAGGTNSGVHQHWTIDAEI